MIILASYGFESTIISGKLKEYFTTDEKVLLIPFAGFTNDYAVRREQKKLENFGFKTENIFACSLEEPLKYYNEKIELIYVIGGNPFKLLEESHMTNIIPWIRKMIAGGVSYFGVSAGADFLCEDLSYLKMVEDDDYEPASHKGIGIIKENILCHADQRDMGTIKRAVEYEPGKKTILIRNDEIYVIDV